MMKIQKGDAILGFYPYLIFSTTRAAKVSVLPRKFFGTYVC